MGSDLTVVLSADSSNLQTALNKAKTTLNEYRNSANKVSGVSGTQAAAFEKSVNSLNKIVNSSKGATKQMKELEKETINMTSTYRSLSEEAKKSDIGKALKTTIEESKKKFKELKEVSDSVKKELGSESKGIDISGLGKTALKGFAGFEVLGTIKDQIKKSFDNMIQFEDALSNLSSITGVSGEGLKRLEEQIKNTGQATSKSYSEIANAYTEVGSKMPELLKQPEALDAITRAAITLSKAARMDLSESISSLTGIMNQMGAPAEQASRYINVLAAGSKEGAGNITYLATAFNQCGTSISSAGLSIEQGTALIEVLASKIPDASTAGTNLRNILLKMMTASDEFNPKVVGMTEAFENLSKKVNDTTFMTKMFGAENINAATTLAQSVEKANELTVAVSGTAEAETQAKTQTDNVAGALRKLNTDWNNFITDINNSQGPLKTAINYLSSLIKLARDSFKTGNERSYDNIDDADTRGKKIGVANEEIKRKKKEIARINKQINDYENNSWKYAHLSVLGRDKIIKKLKEERRLKVQDLENYQKEAKARINASTSSGKTQTPTTSTTTTNTGNGGGTGGNSGNHKGKTTKSDTQNSEKNLSAIQKGIKTYEGDIKNLNAAYQDGVIKDLDYIISRERIQNRLLDTLRDNWSDATEKEKEYYTNLKNNAGKQGTILTKFDSEISSLEKAISDANEELKLVGSGTNINTDNIDKVQNKIKTLNEKLDDLRKQRRLYLTTDESKFGSTSEIGKSGSSKIYVEEHKEEDKDDGTTGTEKILKAYNKLIKQADNIQKLQENGYYEKIGNGPEGYLSDLQSFYLDFLKVVKENISSWVEDFSNTNSTKKVEDSQTISNVNNAIDIAKLIDDYKNSDPSDKSKILYENIKDLTNTISIIKENINDFSKGGSNENTPVKTVVEQLESDLNQLKEGISMNAIVADGDVNSNERLASTYNSVYDFFEKLEKYVETLKNNVSVFNYAGKKQGDLPLKDQETMTRSAIIYDKDEKFDINKTKQDVLSTQVPEINSPSDLRFDPSSINSYTESIQKLQETLESLTIGSQDYMSVQKELNDLQDEYSKKVNKASKRTLKASDKVEIAAESLDSLGGAFQQAGQAFEDQDLEVAGIIMGAIANVAASMASALNRPESKAGGVWGWIAAAAAGTATMIATIASIKSATSGYASGGIIEGATSIGDYNLARVNGGEMILNGTQQARLFNILDGSSRLNPTNEGIADVNFRIEGSTLYGVLNNYNKTKVGKKFL